MNENLIPYIIPPTYDWLPVLLIAIPFIWVVGYHIVSVTFTDDGEEDIRRILIPGIAVIIWLVLVHIISSLIGGFYFGLIAGTLLLCVFGTVLILSYYPKIYLKFIVEVRSLYHILLSKEGGALIICVLVVLPLIFLFDFHDKIDSLVISHFSIVNHILNGFYPPRDLLFPEQHLLYHYGVDSLFAMVAAISNLRFDMAIDVTTLLLFVYSLVLFCYLSKMLFGSKAGVYSICLGAFSGGFPWWLESTNGSVPLLSMYHIDYVIEKGFNYTIINPPLISYFFQHSWTIGIPTVLMIFIVLFSGLFQSRHLNKTIIFFLTLCFIVLSFSNTVLFVTVGATTVGTYLLLYILLRMGLIADCKISQQQYCLYPVSAVFFSFMILPLLGGGFLFPSTHNEGLLNHISLTDNGIGGSIIGSIKWNIATFGFLLPLGLLGLIKTKVAIDAKMFFSLLILGSFIVVNFFEYDRTWDIVKFAVVMQIALTIFTAGFLTLLFNGNHVLSAVRLALLFSTITAGLLYCGAVNIYYGDKVFDRWVTKTEFVSISDQKAISWLRINVLANDIVLRSLTKNAISYATLGGLPILFPDKKSHQISFSDTALDRRKKIFETLPKSIKIYKKEGVRWVVIDTSKEDILNKYIKQWKIDGDVRLYKVFDDIAIYSVEL